MPRSLQRNPEVPESILSTENLIRDFGEFRAVDHVSLEIRRGSITGLIGPNGAGKSTLFHTLTGGLRPTAGRVFFESQEISGLSPDQLFQRRLASTSQLPRPFRRMTVLENVMLSPLHQVGESLTGALFQRRRVKAQEEEIRERALKILSFVTLEPLADQAAGKISGGQMKLLELARVLMGSPSLILLDEPAAGVNPRLTRVLIERIEELNRQGTTFLIIEHDMDFIMRHCNPVIAMAQGRLIFQGTAEEAQSNPVLLEAYLGAPVDV